MRLPLRVISLTVAGLTVGALGGTGFGADMTASGRIGSAGVIEHHSGGYFPQQPGTVLVGAEAARTFDPFSYHWDGDVGDYDDGPHCTIRRQPFVPFLGHRLVRVCR